MSDPAMYYGSRTRWARPRVRHGAYASQGDYPFNPPRRTHKAKRTARVLDSRGSSPYFLRLLTNRQGSLSRPVSSLVTKGVAYEQTCTTSTPDIGWDDLPMKIMICFRSFSSGPISRPLGPRGVSGSCGPHHFNRLFPG